MDVTIADRVRAAIAAELGLPIDELASDASLKTDLGADSIDSYNLVLRLEEEFAIEIQDRDLSTLQTVRQVVTYVQEKVGTVAGYGHGV